MNAACSSYNPQMLRLRGREGGLGPERRSAAPVMRSDVTGRPQELLQGGGLTIQTGGHRPQGVRAFLHVHQQLFPGLNVLDDFIINLGWKSREKG